MLDSISALLASTSALRNKPKHLSWLQYLFSSLFVSLGAILYLFAGFNIGAYSNKITTSFYLTFFLVLLFGFQCIVYDQKKVKKLNILLFAVFSLIINIIIWLV